MPLIAGPALDQLVKELKAWYFKTREELIQKLSEGYPYGSVPLTPSQQVDKFFSMTQEDWKGMSDKLHERHRGKPNAPELVREDLEDYVTRMNKMAFSRRTV